MKYITLLLSYPLLQARIIWYMVLDWLLLDYLEDIRRDEATKAAANLADMVARHLPTADQVADELDPAVVATFVPPHKVAAGVDLEELSEELSLSGVATHVSPIKVADYIDLGDLAEHISDDALEGAIEGYLASKAPNFTVTFE
jgi:hypothetical protein